MNVNFKSIAKCMVVTAALATTLGASAFENTSVQSYGTTMSENSLRILQACNISPSTAFGFELAGVNQGVAHIISQVTQSSINTSSLYQSSGACDVLQEAASKAMQTESFEEKSQLVSEGIDASIESLYKGIVANVAYQSTMQDLFGASFIAPESTIPSDLGMDLDDYGDDNLSL